MAADPKVPIPHHAQETDHTCGPAAIKMVLDGLWGVRVEEESLAQRMATDPKIGTRQRVMERFVRSLGLRATVRHTDTRVEEIGTALDEGKAVIVCYWLPQESTDHYAVVTQVTKDRIVMQDPWMGPDHVLSIRDFDRHWYGDASVPTRRNRWFVAISTVRETGPGANAPGANAASANAAGANAASANGAGAGAAGSDDGRLGA